MYVGNDIDPEILDDMILSTYAIFVHEYIIYSI